MLALVVVSTTWSQNVNIRNGEAFKIGSFEAVEKVLSVNRDGSSTVLMKAGLLGRKFRVLNLNKDLSADSKFEIELPEVEGKKLRYFWAVQLEGRTYFMSKGWDRKSKTYTLFSSEMDAKSGNFKKHHQIINFTDDKLRKWNDPFSATISIDSSKVLFISRYPTKRKENAKYNLKVVNSDMSEVWSKDIEFPEEDRYFTLEDFEVDKDGNVHMIANVMMSRDEKKEKGASSRFQKEIYSYFHASGELKKYEVGFSDQIIQAIDMDVNENNELVGVGFYTERKWWGVGYKGFFYLRIDPTTKEVVASNISPFSEELMTEIIGARRAEKGKDMPPYAIRGMFPMNDGKMGVVCEHYYYSKRTDDDGNTYETWLYGNAMTIIVDKEGKMISGNVLKKKQMCTAKNGSPTLMQRMGIGIYPGVNELPYYGIAIMNDGDNIHLIFNDNPKNQMRLEQGKKPKSVRQRNALTELVTFTSDGKMMRNTLFKAKDRDAGYKMPIMPRVSTQYGKNDMVIFGRKGKNFRVLGITIK